MKIGFVIDDSLDTVDGVQQYILTLGRWLEGQGHEVRYLAGESHRTDLPGLHSLSNNVKVKFNQNRLSIPLPASKKAIRDLMQRERFDVLHVQLPHSPFLAARVVAAAAPHTAVVGTFHILPFSPLERWGTKLLGWYLRRNLRRFDVTLAVSKAAAACARQYFGISPQVLPNVIDVTAFQQAGIQVKPPKRFTIAFLGRLVPRKGTMELLKGINLLPAETKQGLSVRIGGKGPLLDALQAYVRQYQLDDLVTFEGFIDEAAKAEFLGAANIAIFPSLGGESFGIVLIEAMAAGSGVVMGGDNPGYRTVLEEWPQTLVRPDPADCAAGLLAMIADAELRKRIHRQQQQAVKKYDVMTVGPKLLTIYASALSKRKDVR